MPDPRYRFGFVLTTAAGNMTRYLNLRKYAERDPDVECVWSPLSHYLEPDPFRHLPYALRTRLILERQSRDVMRRLKTFDAVMFHAYEPYLWACLRHGVSKRPAIVWSQDNPPLPPQGYEISSYGGTREKSTTRRNLRFAIEQWCARRVALWVPFSEWAGEVIQRECLVPPEKIAAINVGLDLELWHDLPKADTPNSRPKILFVGGEFVRKGGDLLLDVYAQHFAEDAELHLVTKHPPANLPPHVVTHTDFKANDPRLLQLYADCDLFVMPTRADMSPWVVLEAMASGRPVITTRVGGIPDMVRDGETGLLLPPEDPAALREALARLINDAPLRLAMGKAGRARVEQHFNAAVSVPKILDAMKQIVGYDTSR
jgi:glycosyltransferase involved in cell wall biosynthesis